MAFIFRGFDSQQHYDHGFPASSFNVTHISDQTTTEGLWSRGSAGTRHTREEILRELVKERIREEILVRELERCRWLLEGEARRSLEMTATRLPTQFGARWCDMDNRFHRRIEESRCRFQRCITTATDSRGDIGGFDVVTNHYHC